VTGSPLPDYTLAQQSWEGENMTYWKGSALLALACTAATPAHAGNKQMFADCDGLAKPGKSEDGLAGGSVDVDRLVDRQTDAMIAACTAALQSPDLLPTQALRRAHLMRARASAYLRAGDSVNALADLDSAQAATAAFANDALYQRSMGLSLDLMRALAHQSAGNRADAAALVRSASLKRPYALEVQRVAAHILIDGDADAATLDTIWSGLTRLEPSAPLLELLGRASIGDYRSVIALKTRLSPTPAQDAPLASSTDRLGRMMALRSDFALALAVAYARAATGDAAAARHDLAAIRTRFAALSDAPPPAPPLAPATTNTKPKPDPLANIQVAIMSELAQRMKIEGERIELRTMVTEGQAPQALARLQPIAQDLPGDAATVELVQSLRDRLSPAEADKLPPVILPLAILDLARRQQLNQMLSLAMLTPQTAGSIAGYRKSRPNILGALVGGALSMGTSLLQGVNRTDGFRVTPNADGTVSVDITIPTLSQADVKEMALLQAAQVTRQAGKTAFVIVRRQDFIRQLTTTQYGMTLSSVPTGYKTTMTIRFAEPDAKEDRLFNAGAVIDALAPVFDGEGGTDKVA
jgi:hypothetical protein